MHLKVYGYPCHIPHQWALMQMGWCEKYSLQLTPWRTWAKKARPLPQNAEVVPHFDPKDCDLVVLHCMHEALEHEHPARQTFDGIKELTKDFPQVVILHDPPLFEKDGNPSKFEINGIKELVDGLPVVVNSNECVPLWGFGHPIIHGCQEDIFIPAAYKVPRIVSCLSRECEYETVVAEALKDLGIKLFKIRDDFPVNCFGDYLNILSKSLIFLHAYQQSPMPRARTEAAYCGCAIAQVEDSHGAEFFPSAISLPKDDPFDAAEILAKALGDLEKTSKIGVACREEALKNLSWSAYENSWKDFLKTVV